MKEIIIKNAEAGQQFNKYLTKLLPNAGKSFLYKMLRKKNITLNNKKASGNEKICEGDIVKIFFTDETYEKFAGPTAIKKEAPRSKELKSFKLDIVFENDDYICVNKPSGILSQKSQPTDISINEYINAYILDNSAASESTFKPGVVNRLDRNTSGLIVSGKTIYGLQTMSKAFHDRTIDKYYICLCKGLFDTRLKVNAYLNKDCERNRVNIISKEEYLALADSDKEAYDYIETEFIPVKPDKKCSLVKVHLITGKTHQIRAHLSYIGRPIIGDAKYGDAKANEYYRDNYKIKNQMLHSFELVIYKHCDERLSEDLNIRTELPREFVSVLKGEKLWEPGIQEVLEDLH